MGKKKVTQGYLFLACYFYSNMKMYCCMGSLYPLCKDNHAERTTEDIMDTAEELLAIIDEADRRGKMSQFHGYYIYSFMIKAHYEIGCKPGELVALKWTDIRTDPISGNKYFHIHASQRDNRDGNFEYLPFTKNEKGKSKGGRDFPLL